MALGDLTRQALRNHVTDWMRVGLCTDQGDDFAAEEAIERAYRIVGLTPPSQIIWLDSPMSGAIAAALISRLSGSVHDRVWRQPQERMAQKFWNRVQKNRAWWIDVQERINGSELIALRNGVLLPVARQISSHFRTASPIPESNDMVNWIAIPMPARTNTFVPGRRSSVNIPPDAWNNAVRKVRAAVNTDQAAALQPTLTWDQIGRQSATCGFGSMDASFLAFIDYCRLSGFKLGDIEGVADLARTCGWWWPFERFCILTHRPIFVRLDDASNLHFEGDRAIEYADKWGVFALHGATVPEQIARFAGNMNVRAIEAEPNINNRRQMIEMYGLERFLADSGAKQIHADSYGVLFRKDLLGDEPMVVVKVINSTPEPDGSFHEYFLRVPPTITTAHAAVAWTFGLHSLEYTPEAQT